MVVIPSPRGKRGVCFKNANLSSGCNAAWYQAVGLGASCWASGTYTALLCQWLACLHPGLTAVRGRLRRPASSAPSPGRAMALCSAATWTRSHPPKTFLWPPLPSWYTSASVHPTSFCLSSSLVVWAAVTKWELRPLLSSSGVCSSSSSSSARRSLPLLSPFSLLCSPPALRIPSKQTLVLLGSPNTLHPPHLKGLQAAPWAPHLPPKLPSHTPRKQNTGTAGALQNSTSKLMAVHQFPWRPTCAYTQAYYSYLYWWTDGDMAGVWARCTNTHKHSGLVFTRFIVFMDFFFASLASWSSQAPVSGSDDLIN